MLTLVELSRRPVVQAVRYVIQRRAEQISTVSYSTKHEYTTQDCYFVPLLFYR